MNFYVNEIISSYTPSTACELLLKWNYQFLYSLHRMWTFMEMKLSVLILRPPHVNFYGNEIISSYTRPLHVNFYGNKIISSYTPSTACELLCKWNYQFLYSSTACELLWKWNYQFLYSVHRMWTFMEMKLSVLILRPRLFWR